MTRAIIVSLAVALLLFSTALARDTYRATPLRAGPSRFVGTIDRNPGDLCQVGVRGIYWSIGGWLAPPEEYAVYFDPADCGECGAGWAPVGASIMLHTDDGNIPSEVNIRAAVREVIEGAPGCAVPGAAVCWSPTMRFGFDEAGLWEIYLPFYPGSADIDGPHFITVQFEDHESELLPNLVAADGCGPCVCYNDWGFGWVDLCGEPAFPGPPTIFVTLESRGAAATADLDIKPGSCPNPLNVVSQGVLPAAILGTGDFDVSQIDPASILLEGAVSPLLWDYEDVATPMEEDAEPCECNELGSDGYTDMTLKFDTQEVVDAIMPVSAGDEVSIEVTGELLDGTTFSFEDCVWIIDNSKGPMTIEMPGPMADGPTQRSSASTASWSTIKALFR